MRDSRSADVIDSFPVNSPYFDKPASRQSTRRVSDVWKGILTKQQALGATGVVAAWTGLILLAAAHGGMVKEADAHTPRPETFTLYNDGHVSVGDYACRTDYNFEIGLSEKFCAFARSAGAREVHYLYQMDPVQRNRFYVLQRKACEQAAGRPGYDRACTRLTISAGA